MQAQFGDCSFDSETRVLSRNGKAVEVSPKAFRLLECLIGRRPKAISKEDLQNHLWPGTFVFEGNLARLVAEARKAIGDSAREPRYLRTIHGFGYAFAAGAGESETAREGFPGAATEFRLIWGDREIPLRAGENLLGRDPDAAARIDVGSVSRQHARIIVSGDETVIEDLGSKNGTFVRQERVAGQVRLIDGDEVRLGTVLLRFRRLPAGASTETARGA